MQRIKDRVYLDHNATSPPSAIVRAAIPRWLELWGNPSSIHSFGRGPKAVLREARNRVANLVGADPLEIIFTSGGSEANNFALKGVYEANALNAAGKGRNRILISRVEHPSLKLAAESLGRRGAEIEFIEVDRQGRIDIESFHRRLDERVLMVSVMLANNETGSLFPIRELARAARAYGALFHADCVQGLGKIDIDLHHLGVDLASFSGHKFYALKGAGFLFSRRGLRLESLIEGGGQERNRRGGTENLLAIASLGEMCAAKPEISARAERMAELRDHFESRVTGEINGLRVTAQESSRLPNTSSVVIDGIDGETLLMNLDLKGYGVSTGAACSSGSPEPSPVLLAMGLSRSEAQSSLRVGLGWDNTLEQVDGFVDCLQEVVEHLRTFRRMERESHVNL